eukprot:857555-Pleurochrysis_carterae.AAC.1
MPRVAGASHDSRAPGLGQMRASLNWFSRQKRSDFTMVVSHCERFLDSLCTSSGRDTSAMNHPEKRLQRHTDTRSERLLASLARSQSAEGVASGRSDSTVAAPAPEAFADSPYTRLKRDPLLVCRPSIRLLLSIASASACCCEPVKKTKLLQRRSIR